MKYEYSNFGKAVKKELIEINKSQEWLIEQIKCKTGLFVDSSYLNRIITGRSKNKKIINAIAEILELDNDEVGQTDAIDPMDKT